VQSFPAPEVSLLQAPCLLPQPLLVVLNVCQDAPDIPTWTLRLAACACGQGVRVITFCPQTGTLDCLCSLQDGWTPLHFAAYGGR